MKNKTIAQQLIQGSQNLDRIQQEMKQLISMVVGFAKTMISIPDEGASRFTSKTCEWSISIMYSPNANYRCIQTIRIVATRGIKILFFDLKENRFYFDSKEDLLVFYKDRQTFVDGMMKVFPGIEEKWAYLIEASEL